MERFAAAATPFLIWIAEGKPAFEFFFYIIHFAANQKNHRLGVDQHADAVFFDDFVEFTDVIGIFDRIGQPRAAARANADLDARRRLAALVEQYMDTAQSRIGDGDDRGVAILILITPHPDGFWPCFAL